MMLKMMYLPASMPIVRVAKESVGALAGLK